MRGVFAIGNLGPQPIKGLDQPVEVFEVQGCHAHRGRFEARARQGLVGIVGRTLELGLLETRWRRATSGEGQVALLTGEPGIGKSRVLRALRDSENVRPKSRATVHCSPYHTQAALHPFAEVLARSLAEDGSADRATRRNSFGIFSRKPAPIGARPSTRWLGWFRSPPRGDPPATDAQEERTQTLDALVDLLLGAVHQQPRLLLIEDVHWIDPSSHELLNRLVDLVPTLPVLLVITARLEFVPSWRHGGHVTNLNLGRLEPEQAALLIDRIAEPTKLNVAIRDQIAAMADGVPLFVEELTKTLLESGSEGGEALAGSSDIERPTKIPATLHDVLMARLDRMPAAKTVAQTAAATGGASGTKP